MQQDNDPKHTSKFSSVWLKKTNQSVVMAESKSRSQPIDMLWQALKAAVHKRMP